MSLTQVQPVAAEFDEHRSSRAETGGRSSVTVTPPPVSFDQAIVLTKAEVFSACQALADADRALLRSGRATESAALADLFDLLERRLARI